MDHILKVQPQSQKNPAEIQKIGQLVEFQIKSRKKKRKEKIKLKIY